MKGCPSVLERGLVFSHGFFLGLLLVAVDQPTHAAGVPASLPW